MVSNPERVDVVLVARGAPSAAWRAPRSASIGRPRPRARRRADEDPEEALIGALRRAKARVTMEVGLADLSSQVGTREAHARALGVWPTRRSRPRRASRWGRRRASPCRGLAVIAMGKLGGREIGYGSDLDVFFLFDPAGAARRARGLVGPGTYYARRARQIIRLISMSHAAGPGYELDTRLRPSGSQGLLVTSRRLVCSLPRHPRRGRGGPRRPRSRGRRPARGTCARRSGSGLALIRARASAGDPELGAEAIAIAHEAAYLQADDFDPRVAEEIHRLRLRLERELSHERRRPPRLQARARRPRGHRVRGAAPSRSGTAPIRASGPPRPLAAIDALAAAGHLSAQHAETFRGRPRVPAQAGAADPHRARRRLAAPRGGRARGPDPRASDGHPGPHCGRGRARAARALRRDHRTRTPGVRGHCRGRRGVCR